MGSEKALGGHRELEALKEKIHRAGELIGSLKRANRKLASELESIRHRLRTQEMESEVVGGEGPPPSAASSPGPQESRLQSELKLFRRERREVRKKIHRLLERLERLEDNS